MLANIAIDFAIGLLPVLGDVADALFRANTKNAALLHQHLKERGASRIAAGEKQGDRKVGLRQDTAPVAPDRTQGSDRPQGLHQPPQAQRTEHGHGTMPGDKAASGAKGAAKEPQPQQSSSRGWFGRSGFRSKGVQGEDLESGELSDLASRRQ